jgi:protein phosphatase inhibitor 2
MSRPPYATTHPHPTHIDIPPLAPSRAPEDLPETLDGGVIGTEPEVAQDIPLDSGADHGPSASRPPPPRGILKNPLRRLSQPTPNEGPLSPATDAERVQWDEANIAATEIEKDSLMCGSVALI